MVKLVIFVLLIFCHNKKYRNQESSMGRGETYASSILFQSKGTEKPGMAACDCKSSTVGGRGGSVINASSAWASLVTWWDPASNWKIRKGWWYTLLSMRTLGLTPHIKNKTNNDNQQNKKQKQKNLCWNLKRLSTPGFWGSVRWEQGREEDQWAC